MYGNKEKDKREIRVDLIINTGKGRLRKGNFYTRGFLRCRIGA